MKPVSFTSILLAALTVSSSNVVNAQLNTELADFLRGVGLSAGKVDAIISAFDRRAQNCGCKLLESIYPDITYQPSEVLGYNAKVSINWSTRAWLKSKCIFSPRSAKETAAGVKIAGLCNTKFAIRSGGHTPDPEMASITDGILFSLDSLNQIDVDAEKKIASIGPGNTWGDVYASLGLRDFLVAGGRVPPVGVGGLLTGGGLSYFSGTEGFSADTVVNYEVVLGDGKIVNANATSNSDLWWALKGGGNNFGIVTRFDMKAIPKKGGLVWGGSLVFTEDKFENLTAAIAEFQAKGQITDPKAAIIPSFIRVTTDTGLLSMCMMTVFHQDPTDTPPASLQHFLDIGPTTSTAGPKTLKAVAEDAYGPAALVPPMRQLFRTISIKADPALYKKTIDLFTSTYALLDFTLTPGLQVSVTFQPISTAIVAAGDSTGGHALGVPRVSHSWIIINCAWLSELSDASVIATAKGLIDKVGQMAMENNLDVEFTYLNDASKDQKIMESYGAANLNRMREVSKKFDTKQVFQKLVPGGFKLY